MGKRKRSSFAPPKPAKKNKTSTGRGFRDGESVGYAANSPSEPFVTLRFNVASLESHSITKNQYQLGRQHQDIRTQNLVAQTDMKTRNAWQYNKANSSLERVQQGPGPAATAPTGALYSPQGQSLEPQDESAADASSGLPAAAHRRAKSRLKPVRKESKKPNIKAAVETSAEPRKLNSGKENRTPESDGDTAHTKHVHFDIDSDIGLQSDTSAYESDGAITDQGSDSIDDTFSEMPDGQPSKPALKLSFKNLNGGINSQQGTPQTPAPPSATRTPSISLTLKTKPTLEDSSKPKKRKKEVDNADGEKKKRRKSAAVGDGASQSQPPPAPGGLLRKLTFKNTAKPTLQTPITPAPQIKLKAKGKKPKRPPGVGYDSELDEKEDDPYIFDAWILRMPLGPDRDAVQKALEDGRFGGSRQLGVPYVSVKALDILGRRGVLAVDDRRYAFTMVDLPCIVEGMKSWDKRGWIKSVDVSQMMLVLGRCSSDEEARNYPLPEDVDPKNFQYAHGITPPMKYVRKRRFVRTKRTRVDDIEAVERRVNALLEADAKALSVDWKVLDHDPREVQSEDEDAEAESYEASEDEEDYFNRNYGSFTQEGQTPAMVETPAHEIGEEDVDEFERMLQDAEEEVSTQVTSHAQLLAAAEAESSFAVTSTSASPSATLAHTPASAAEASSDEDDDDDEDKDEDMDDAEKEGDEQMQQARDRIADMESKIAEQLKVLEGTTNGILRRKIAKKIQDLRDDVGMMKRSAGLQEGDGDEDD